MAKRRLTREQVADAFGRALVRARHDADMTQEQLAVAAGLHRTTIGLFERGLKCPTLETVIRLAQAMQLRTAQLAAAAEAEMR